MKRLEILNFVDDDPVMDGVSDDPIFPHQNSLRNIQSDQHAFSSPKSVSGFVTFQRTSQQKNTSEKFCCVNCEIRMQSIPKKPLALISFFLAFLSDSKYCPFSQELMTAAKVISSGGSTHFPQSYVYPPVIRG